MAIAATELILSVDITNRNDVDVVFSNAAKQSLAIHR